MLQLDSFLYIIIVVNICSISIHNMFCERTCQMPHYFLQPCFFPPFVGYAIQFTGMFEN